MAETVAVVNKRLVAKQIETRMSLPNDSALYKRFTLL
jgi:hypothetical protein